MQRTHAIPLQIREDQERPLPQEDCMSMRRIIALDLGKFKAVACVMNAADRGGAAMIRLPVVEAGFY